MNLDGMMLGYVECALWASTEPDTDEPLDRRYTVADFTDEARAAMRADCESFLAACNVAGLNLDALEPEQVGHDFFLTRNGHGAGFWDRGLGELGDKLTDLCRHAGEAYVYGGGDTLDYEGGST